MQMFLVSLVTTLLIQNTFTKEYADKKEYTKFILLTMAYSLPISFTLNALVTYIRS